MPRCDEDFGPGSIKKGMRKRSLCRFRNLFKFCFLFVHNDLSLENFMFYFGHAKHQNHLCGCLANFHLQSPKLLKRRLINSCSISKNSMDTKFIPNAGKHSPKHPRKTIQSSVRSESNHVCHSSSAPSDRLTLEDVRKHKWVTQTATPKRKKKSDDGCEIR